MFLHTLFKKTFDWLFDCLFDSFIDCLVGWLIAWSVDWLIDWFWIDWYILLFFLAFDFCSFCVVIVFSSPPQRPMTSEFEDFYTRSYPLHYFLISKLEKGPVFPFSMFSAKQGNYWYHFDNVFCMTRSLTGDWTRDLPHSKSALYPCFPVQCLIARPL